MAADKPHIVLVDHDLEALKALVAPLRQQFDFHLTLSGSDALALLDRETISVLIAGQTLFSGTGLEVLSAARQRSPRTTRVLLADAIERQAVQSADIDGGLCQLLNRPCTSQQLRDFLRVVSWSAGLQSDEGPPEPVEHVVLETPGEQPQATTATEGAPITVLTTDADLFEAIRSAVHGRHEAYLATRIESAVELAVQGRCPVLVTDLALQQTALQRITGRLQAHEPALVTIMVGSREQGNALLGLLSTGVIHRFLLKPVTPGLARLAIDSAARQHLVLKSQPRVEPSFEFRPLAEIVATPNEVEPEPQERAQRPQSRWLRNLLVGTGVLALLAAGAILWWQFANHPPAIDSRQVAIERNLAAGRQALLEQRLIAPPATSALHFYSKVLELEPKNAPASKGIDSIADRFVEQAETHMVQGQPEAAARALDTVRSLRPNHRRLTFLETQMHKEQQEQLLLQARQSATVGNLRHAQELLDQAAKVNPGTSTDLSSAQQTIDAHERSQSVARWIDSARQRVAQGRLVSPANDNAKFYLRSAQQAEPDNVVVQQGLRDLAERVAAEAERAIGHSDLDAARSWLRQAEDLGVETAEVTRLRQALLTAADQKSKHDLLQLVLRRTDENRLLEPASDSAVHHLNRLALTDAAFPGLESAAQALGAKLIASARQATAQRQFDAASRLLTAAHQIGHSGPELVAAETALRTARAPVPIPPRIPQEVPPKRVKYVAPKYPQNAIVDGTEGWVDLSFMVTAAGDVADIKIEGSSRRNTFERAAIAAVRQWKFEPRTGLDPSFTQQVKTRVQFKLEE